MRDKAPLPRSLIPLPDEEISGYFMRMSHRLEQSPRQLADDFGIALSIRFLLRALPDEQARLAGSCRLTEAEATRLFLASLANSYPPLDLNLTPFDNPNRTGVWLQQAQRIPALNRWVFTRRTRYCPDCLAGDSNPIQVAHGGPWKRLWRLPLVFACTSHRRLLATHCPHCHQPIGLTHRLTADFIPQAGVLLHPAQCRVPIPSTASARPDGSICGQRLDSAATSPLLPDGIAPILATQHQLLNLLREGSTSSAMSMGTEISASQYFLDLRLATIIVRSTWPATAELAGTPEAIAALHEHVDQRRRLQHDRQPSTKRGAFFDTPPSDPLASVGLFAAATQILSGTPSILPRDLLEPLLATISTETARRNLISRTALTCSPALRTHIHARLADLHERARGNLKPRRSRPQPPRLTAEGRSAVLAATARKWHRRLGHTVIVPTGDCRFDHTNIPQHMSDDWFDRHFAAVTDINPLHIRRTAAIRLVQMSTGGTMFSAGAQLDIPHGRVMSSTHTVRVWTRDPANEARLTAAIGEFADELNDTPNLINYGHRRYVLKDWEIPLDEWVHLGRLLPTKPRRISWTDRRRRFATVLTWARVTEGDHHLAPLVRAEQGKANRGHTNTLMLDVQQALYARSRHPDGPLSSLQLLIEEYARNLAKQIDDRRI